MSPFGGGGGGEKGGPARSIPLPWRPGEVVPAGRSGPGALRRFGGQGLSEVQAPALGDVAVLLLLSAAELAGAPSRSKALALLISGEAPSPPLRTHTRTPPRSSPLVCLTPETTGRGRGGGRQLRDPPCQTSGIPPCAGTARLSLDDTESGSTGEIKAPGRGGGERGRGTRTQRTRRQGGPRGRRAPVARRGAGCHPRRGFRGAGEAPGALPSGLPPSPSDANSLKAAEITGEGRRTSAGAGLLKTVPPHRL